MAFSRNQCLNIAYPNGNYPFVLAYLEKKLDSFHERSSSHFKDNIWFPTKRSIQMFFSWNQVINIECPNGNYPFSWPVAKRKYILVMNEVHPVLRTNFDSQPIEGLKCFSHETKASILFIPVDAPFYPDYLFHFNVYWTLGPFVSKARVWASNLFRYVVYLFLSNLWVISY